MLNIFLALIPVALYGSFLRVILPNPDEARITLNKIVLYAFLPALVFHTISICPVNSLFFIIPLTASLTIITIIFISFLTFNYMDLPRETKGAMILAASFGNVTYLGLPLLQKMFPQHLPEVSEVAVLYEVTKSSLNLTLGSVIAISYGSQEAITLNKTVWEALKLPPIWALFLALMFKMTGFQCPSFILDGAQIMAVSVTGMMVLSLGMAFRFQPTRNMLLVFPVAGIKLLFAPYVASVISDNIGLKGLIYDAIVLEAAMPSQLLSFVIAGRYRLDETTLSFVIFVDTIFSLATIPFIKYAFIR